jgi:hypothetical protein
MPGSQNTSFIPKHTPSQTERKNSPRQLFIGTLIVRVGFFAVLIASIGVFAYERRLEKQLGQEVSNFNQAASSFEVDEAKLQAVVSMDKRLIQANNRLKSSVSIVALLRALEVSTIETVQIKSLELTRENDATILLAAEIDTDTFDSVIFQRAVLEGSEVLGAAEIQDVTIQNLGPIDDTRDISDSVGISFNAEIAIAPKTIAPQLTQDQVFTTPSSAPAPAAVAPATPDVPVEAAEVNQESL